MATIVTPPTQPTIIPPLSQPPAAPASPGTGAPRVRYYLQQSTFRRFTLDEYHKMIETGVLIGGEPFELLEGNLVKKMSHGTAHDHAMDLLEGLFQSLALGTWFVRCQRAIALPQSEPEPDYAIVRGPRSRYAAAHPGPADIGLIIEVADSSLLIDRHDKGSIYARANLPVYWVVNVVDRIIEVYTQPAGTGEDAAYAKRDDFAVGSSVSVVLDGATVGNIAVADVMG
jgi:Uma2 family endonuclease